MHSNGRGDNYFYDFVTDNTDCMQLNNNYTKKFFDKTFDKILT